MIGHRRIGAILLFYKSMACDVKCGGYTADHPTLLNKALFLEHRFWHTACNTILYFPNVT